MARRRRRRNPDSKIVLAVALAGAGTYLYTQGEARKLPPEIQAIYDQMKNQAGKLLPSGT